MSELEALKLFAWLLVMTAANFALLVIPTLIVAAAFGYHTRSPLAAVWLLAGLVVLNHMLAAYVPQFVETDGTSRGFAAMGAMIVFPIYALLGFTGGAIYRQLSDR